MTEQHDNHHQAKSRWVFYGFLAVAGFFLLAEHRAHLYGWLSSYGIWLLLLACPLMHLFMHHDHGSQKQHANNHDSSKGESK